MTIARVFKDQGINIYKVLRTQKVKSIKITATKVEVLLR